MQRPLEGQLLLSRPPTDLSCWFLVCGTGGLHICHVNPKTCGHPTTDAYAGHRLDLQETVEEVIGHQEEVWTG